LSHLLVESAGHFFRTINIIQPKFFVMENVEGLLDNGNKEELDKAIAILDNRYVVLPPLIVNAYEYGAPTKRKRVVVVRYGSKEMNKLSPRDLLPTGVPQTNVKDAISDIPSPILQDDSYGWAGYRNVTMLSNYAIRMRRLPPKELGWNISIEKLTLKEISGNFETIHTEKVKDRYAAVLPSAVDKMSRSKKLEWDGACPTLRAGTGADKGSYQAVRPLHPDEPRVITVREAARLQGFPDWFCFHTTKWHSFRMIGNSVSPILAESILAVIYSKLSERKATKASSL
jgi:DNA (cytosine-5)-methyltransferase 1